ncbi:MULTISPECIES: ABC transporter ATP-binding protein [Rhodopseudomonas]|uniref:Peptide ABC transporter ATP-binding protein n=1 Tax=Rhodopseudomonas palustris TaxID=1076 RepID=A0A0D7EMA5_RHOPL|nr:MULTISPECIES: ABC transporter ATP-binding protein [Rhodopseudomonas]KIZ41928.1 peptide ABC transporter ATP-binding protein [Rhodopseudomonas palustris]MDF3814090.1 ABC transporter ATP-binding protein [Rhodopseudomonas sp. BAL398]WOK20735.1 ABC transporter ATP-binding protein [Rhodopseudomonas sp. BAL398]
MWPVEASPYLLDVNDLVVHFRTGRQRPWSKPSFVHAVDGVSFRVRRGTTFGIVGESGSGKSTTAQAIMRLVPATSGQIVFRGEDIAPLAGEPLRRVRRHLQIVFQDPFSALDPRRRAGDQVREPLDLLQIGTPSERDARVLQLLAEVGLPPEAADLFPHQFSGGQRQRLCIARALAPEPELIVCDEAVSALDVAIQAQILNLLKKLQRERGLTYIFISHDLGVIQHFCDEIAVMYLGKIAEQAPASVLFTEPRHPYTWSLVAAAVPPGPLRDELKARYLVKGDPPSPVDPPPGCRFAQRCPFALDHCREVSPFLDAIGPEHFVACHRKDEIPRPDFTLNQATA